MNYNFFMIHHLSILFFVCLFSCSLFSSDVEDISYSLYFAAVKNPKNWILTAPTGIMRVIQNRVKESGAPLKA